MEGGWYTTRLTLWELLMRNSRLRKKKKVDRHIVVKIHGLNIGWPPAGWTDDFLQIANRGWMKKAEKSVSFFWDWFSSSFRQMEAS